MRMTLDMELLLKNVMKVPRCNVNRRSLRATEVQKREDLRGDFDVMGFECEA